MINIFNHYYELSVIVNEKPSDKTTESMAKAIAYDFIQALQFVNFDRKKFPKIEVHEYELGAKPGSPTWFMELHLLSEEEIQFLKDSGPQLDPSIVLTKRLRGEFNVASENCEIAIKSRQFYKAIHKLNSDLDYSGYFEVDIFVATPITEDDPEYSLGKMLCALMHDYYRRRIYEFFPDWETDYVDTACDYIVSPGVDIIM